MTFTFGQLCVRRFRLSGSKDKLRTLKMLSLPVMCKGRNWFWPVIADNESDLKLRRWGGL